MDRIKRFVCIGVPDSVCNLKCQYCYLRYCGTQKHSFKDFKVDVNTFRRALSKGRLGGVCMFNFTSNGETLLNLKIIDYAVALIEEGHYVEIVTNATNVKAIRQICELPRRVLSHLMLKCSFHYLELERVGLMDVFFDNVNLVWRSGASITVELMPTDELLPYRQKIYDLCMHRIGAPCHLTVARNPAVPNRLPLLSKLSYEEYANAWEMFDSELFRYKMKELESHPLGFCYAGDWMMFFNPMTGMMSQCYSGYRRINIFKDIDARLKFKAIGNHCRQPYCFNAHAWLTFGCIPGHDAPYYDEVRNRKCEDGREWLQPEMKSFFHQKFGENNSEYATCKKIFINIEMTVRSVLFFPVSLGGRIMHLLIPMKVLSMIKNVLMR